MLRPATYESSNGITSLSAFCVVTFLAIDFIISMKWNIPVVLIFISPLIANTEHFFRSLSNYCSFLKYLFNSSSLLVIFKYWAFCGLLGILMQVLCWYRFCKYFLSALSCGLCFNFWMVLWLEDFYWRWKVQSNPVFLPAESQGQRSLVGCRLWGRTKLGTTDAT